MGPQSLQFIGLGKLWLTNGAKLKLRDDADTYCPQNYRDRVIEHDFHFLKEFGEF